MNDILRELYLSEKIGIDYIRGLLDGMRITLEDYLYIIK